MRFYSLILFILASIIVGANTVNAQSSDFKPGDLIKIPENQAVYYFGYDGKRHAFPNEPTYFTWYENFNTVKIITSEELAQIPLGKNIVVRPGTQLVKIISDPKVYAVEPKGRLRHITAEADALALFGQNWNKNVIDIPDTFFTDYDIREPLPSKYIPTGTVIKDGNELVVLTNGYTRKLTQDSSFINYHYVAKYNLEINKDNFNLQKGDDFSSFKVALSDTAQTLIDDNGADILHYPNGAGGQAVGSNGLPAGTLGNGLLATYYNGLNFETQVLQRIDPEVNFDWELKPPVEGAWSDDFTVRWEGKIKIDEGGLKKFFIFSDDGARLFIDNKLVINNWMDQPAEWAQGTIQLGQGTYDIRVEYFDTFLHANMILSWNSQDQVIPFSHLFYTNTAN